MKYYKLSNLMVKICFFFYLKLIKYFLFTSHSHSQLTPSTKEEEGKP